MNKWMIFVFVIFFQTNQLCADDGAVLYQKGQKAYSDMKCGDALNFLVQYRTLYYEQYKSVKIKTDEIDGAIKACIDKANGEKVVSRGGSGGFWYKRGTGNMKLLIPRDNHE